MRKMLLLDINVWIAMTFDSHEHYAAATTWFNAVKEQQIFFCRMTQQGFLRLACNPRVSGQNALTLAQAWHTYDQYLDDPRVSFAEEPVDLEKIWRDYTQHQSFSHHVWSDAYLAAFAVAGGYELVTFDKACAKYAGVNCTVLT